MEDFQATSHKGHKKTIYHMYTYIYIYISGWRYTYPSEKYECSSVGMMTFPIYGTIKHVPNYQYIYMYIYLWHLDNVSSIYPMKRPPTGEFQNMSAVKLHIWWIDSNGILDSDGSQGKASDRCEIWG